MPPRMTTRSAGRATVTPRGGRTCGRTSRGGGRTRGQSSNQGNGRIDGQGSQVGGQGSKVNDGVDGVPDFSTIIAQQLQNLLPTILAQGDVRNVIVNNNRRGCTYKEFLACNLKEYDEKGGSMSCLATEPETIQRVVQKAGTLTNEAVRNGSLKKNLEKRRNSGEPNRDRNIRDKNKRSRTGNAFAATTNPVRREYNGIIPKVAPRMVNLVNARSPTTAPGACYECGGTDHFKAISPRLNQAQRPGGNRPNQVVANNGVQGRGNNSNQVRRRVFMLGAKEARQDPNIVMGTFTLNDHYVTTLFDSGTDYSFVSTTFIPLLGIEPSELGFSYEIEIASGQLVEIDKVIRGYKLEIEGHIFDINLILFRSGSFDVIIGMDWLSNHKAEIICHEKVVRIPLQDGQVLRVIGERLVTDI
ncbi:putative reverse transcriptase domain-containing protein [Tanacetum coccineum]